MDSMVDEEKMKNVMKQAIIEVLEERRAFLYDIITEAVEDIGLLNAIKEGENSRNVTRDEIFKILDGAR